MRAVLVSVFISIGVRATALVLKYHPIPLDLLKWLETILCGHGDCDWHAIFKDKNMWISLSKFAFMFINPKIFIIYCQYHFTYVRATGIAQNNPVLCPEQKGLGMKTGSNLSLPHKTWTQLKEGPQNIYMVWGFAIWLCCWLSRIYTLHLFILVMFCSLTQEHFKQSEGYGQNSLSKHNNKQMKWLSGDYVLQCHGHICNCKTKLLPSIC